MSLINFCHLSFQTELQERKMAKLEEIVGKGKVEEEPEGEMIMGPSGEAVGSSGSGNTPFFLFGIKFSL